MTPDQLEKKIQQYQNLLAQAQDGAITLSIQLDDALAKVEALRTEVETAEGKAAEVPAADEDLAQEASLNQ